MINFINQLSENNIQGRQAIARVRTFIWQIFLLGLMVFWALVFLVIGPSWSIVAWMIYLLGLFVILYKPRYGIYLIVFLSLIGDQRVMPWFPFVKNFSSRESLLYIHDSIFFAPVDTYLIITAISWLARGTVRRKYSFYKSSLFFPAMFFLLFIIIGFVYGVGKGGDVNIAVWQARPIFYLIMMIVLATNLLEKREHYNWVIWSVMLAVIIKAIHGLYIFITVVNAEFSLFDQAFEHSAAIHFNTYIIFVVLAWVFRASIYKRISLSLLLPFVAFMYMAMQRRAGFLTLGISLVLVAFFLFRESRIAFSLIIPPLAVAAIIYIVIFWNSSGALGIPAQAVKSVISNDQANAADQSSDRYRILENANISFTIHTSPVMGIGFGHKFYVIYPMADISSFEWWQYFPHNSIMWVWLNMGVGGFVAMLFLAGFAIMIGVRAVLRLPRGDLRSIALTATLYVLMHFIFAYADLSWGAPSMVYLGTMMGVIGSIEHVTEKQVYISPKRWHWQKDAEPVPSLKPLSSKNLIFKSD